MSGADGDVLGAKNSAVPVCTSSCLLWAKSGVVHSMTSSTPASSDTGICIPVALAVLRFITSSNTAIGREITEVITTCEPQQGLSRWGLCGEPLFQETTRISRSRALRGRSFGLLSGTFGCESVVQGRGLRTGGGILIEWTLGMIAV